MRQGLVNIDTKWQGEEIKIRGKKVIGKTTFETGLVVEGQAKLLCAIRYGYLAASINTQSKDEGTDLTNPSDYSKETPPDGHNVESFRLITKPDDDKEVLVGTAVDYGPHIEFGTYKMDAQPFLRPSLDLAKGRVLKIGLKNAKYYFKNYLVAGAI